MSDVILRLSHITKLFPGVRALDDVSMEFRRGEVHALMGENGAGKSTLIKLLTGAHAPTGGEITFEEERYPSLRPRQAMDLGITAIYQEFNLVPYLSVAENVFYGNELMKGVFLDKGEMRRRTAAYTRDMEVQIDPGALVKDIGVAHMQIVEIIKAISHNTKVLIMDEPTAPLTNREIEALFRLVRRLRETGMTILYISHRLEEIFEICDRVSIMRDGAYIGTHRVADITRQELIAKMVGRDLNETYPQGAAPGKEIALEVKNLTAGKLRQVSFQLRRGEILGLGGLVGAGRTETARAIFGADRLTSGEILRNGVPVSITSPADAIRHGIGLLPEDRKGQGLVLGMGVRDNMVYAILKRLSKGPLLDRTGVDGLCEQLVWELRIKTPSKAQLVKFLSGGNQQKVVLAKWLATQSDVLLFDEPTRGIDVGAKQEIYQLMRRLTGQGKSILMISSEMPELLGMSDRLLIMFEGRIQGELLPHEYSQERVLELASGQ